MRMRCRHWLKILNVNNFNYVCPSAIGWRRRICEAHNAIIETTRCMKTNEWYSLSHFVLLGSNDNIIFFFAIKYVAL